MAYRQTRRSISFNISLYETIKKHAASIDVPMAQWVESVIARELGFQRAVKPETFKLARVLSCSEGRRNHRWDDIEDRKVRCRQCSLLGVRMPSGSIRPLREDVMRLEKLRAQTPEPIMADPAEVRPILDIIAAKRRVMAENEIQYPCRNEKCRIVGLHEEHD